MITQKELEEIGFNKINDSEFADAAWNYMFNIKTQNLYATDEINEPEFLCRVTKIEKLKELINII
jgi:hypothetical protein